MGGTITLESEPSKGSEFIVNLCFPLSGQKAEIKQLPSWKGCGHWWRTTTPTPA